MDNKKYRTDIKKPEMDIKRKEEVPSRVSSFLEQRAELNKQPVKADDYYSTLNQDKMIVSGGTEKITNPEKMVQTPIEDFQLRQRYRDAAKELELEEKAKQAGKTIETLDYNELRKQMPKASRFGKLAAKLGKSIPVIGGVATALTALNSEDAAAAVGDTLVPGGLEGAGLTNDPLYDKLQSGERLSQEEQKEMLRRQALQNMAMRTGQK